MNIAIIHSYSSVGGCHFLVALVCGLEKYYPNIKISVFSDVKDITVGIESLSPYLIDTPTSFKRKKYFHIKILDNVINHFRKRYHKIKSNNLIEHINTRFDIMFYTWFYSCQLPMPLYNPKIPTFFIIHDLIVTHFFGLHSGMQAYSYNESNLLKQRILDYINSGSIPCFATEFVRQDFLKHFPHYNGKTYVVLSHFKKRDEVDLNKCEEILKKYDVPKDYIIYPTNDMLHKNMGQALSGYFIAKQKHPNLKMIIVGYGTKGIRLKMENQYYATNVDKTQDYDIKSFGMVDDITLSVLIKNAKLLLNTSLCEAACGSGIDAWHLGTPTAISDIPCYKEQVEKLGVKTKFFNPRQADDIGKAILNILDNPQKAQEDAKYSYNIMMSQSCEKSFVDNYVRIFKEYIVG